MIAKYLLLVLMLLSFLSCQSPQDNKTNKTVKSSVPVIPKKQIVNYEEFSRDVIKKQLKDKIVAKEDLLVHVFVPLCDNEHQGIVPVSKSLGDGLSLRTNLYWATRDGMSELVSINPL